MPKLAILIDSSIIGDLYLRSGHPDEDISGWIENVVRDYLERTADDEWSEAYEIYRNNKTDQLDFVLKFGDPSGGVHWPPLFLPNGTSIRMVYKKQTFQAVVKNNAIDYNGSIFSPSELARHIASGTSRNAWRDLMIKRPNDTEWHLADELRMHTFRS